MIPVSPATLGEGDTARPVERYLRAQVEVVDLVHDQRGSRRVVLGVVEIGMHYADGEVGRLQQWRSELVALGVCAVTLCERALDAVIADAITRELDRMIVERFGDRPRFVEVWRGAGDDAEPLTQVYAPHGWPRTRLIRLSTRPVFG